jgi:hypothetical protein
MNTMSIKKSDPSPWTHELAHLTGVLDAAQKQMRNLSHDPFGALKQIDSIRDRLRNVGIKEINALEEVRRTIERDCLRGEMEFWGLFSDECTRVGWDLHGSTNRRLVRRATFVELEGRSVKIEGVSTTYTPFVPTVMTALSAQLQSLGGSQADPESFLTILAKAFDNTPKPAQECSLEAIFRQCILEVQKATFWRNPSSGTFTSLTRPMFRFQLSEIIRLGLSTTDGRTITLGTTTMNKDAWELYSPGEQRVVLAGRISLARGGTSRGN